jgi:vacuolar-type H+-ATPase subunit I/STV1
MNRLTWLLIVAWGLLQAMPVGAQDAATEERLNRLTGQIEDLVTAHKGLQKQIREVADAVETLRAQVNKPNTTYLTGEDLKPLLEAIREIDRKRVADAEKIQDQLKEIQRLAAAAPPPPRRVEKPPADKPERGYEYEVQEGDTLLGIIAAVNRERNLKITMDQVRKANPGLVPERMRVGQKIFLPAP